MRVARVLAARELEQPRDEIPHLVRLALEVGIEPVSRVGREPVLLLQHVDVRLDARQRRAQLVRGVGDEAALRLDRVVEGGEHRVERRAEARQLAAPGLGNAFARIARARDALRGCGQAQHRGERRARDERAGERGGEDAAERHEQQDETEAAEVVVDVVDDAGDDDGAAARERNDHLAQVVVKDRDVAEIRALRAGSDAAHARVDGDALREPGGDLAAGADERDVVAAERARARGRPRADPARAARAPCRPASRARAA